ncbi:MAG: CheR family methyltransferase [Desulfohalobiaceae bacterium]
MSSGKAFDEFLRQVCPPRDLGWRKYRRASKRKVMQRIRELGLKGLDEYARYLDEHPKESEVLPNILRVTLSRFFRESEVWHKLAAEIVPGLLKSSQTYHTLQALSIGCCNGEEPYSLALLWKSGIQQRFPGAEIKITALDVDPSCLERARAGMYSRKTLREVPQHILDTWFHRESSGFFRLHPEIRNMVSFYPSDMLQEHLPGNQDLILCRYLVFTYFQGGKMQRVARRIISSLSPSGCLVTGKKEELGLEHGNGLSSVPGMPVFYLT